MAPAGELAIRGVVPVCISGFPLLLGQEAKTYISTWLLLILVGAWFLRLLQVEICLWSLLGRMLRPEGVLAAAAACVGCLKCRQSCLPTPQYPAVRNVGICSGVWWGFCAPLRVAWCSYSMGALLQPAGIPCAFPELL